MFNRLVRESVNNLYPLTPDSITYNQKWENIVQWIDDLEYAVKFHCGNEIFKEMIEVFNKKRSEAHD